MAIAARETEGVGPMKSGAFAGVLCQFFNGKLGAGIPVNQSTSTYEDAKTELAAVLSSAVWASATEMHAPQAISPSAEFSLPTADIRMYAMHARRDL